MPRKRKMKRSRNTRSLSGSQYYASGVTTVNTSTSVSLLEAISAADFGLPVNRSTKVTSVRFTVTSEYSATPTSVWFNLGNSSVGKAGTIHKLLTPMSRNVVNIRARSSTDFTVFAGNAIVCSVLFTSAVKTSAYYVFAECWAVSGPVNPTA
jgi:hypothetical protein